jgi:hypothetical protein
MFFNAPITPSSSADQTEGVPLPLAFGYVWATGLRKGYYQLGEPLTTGDSALDYTRVGYWILGDGEWDGPMELWTNDTLIWNGDTTITSNWKGWNWYDCLDNARQRIVFNFHRGADSIIGSGLTPGSYGPDQGVDALWSLFPSAIQPLHFSRMAYYGLMRKQPIENQTNTHQNDPSQWTDLAPIGLWRALRCRLFDDEGNQTGYAFTTNPAWHRVELYLRRKVFPDWGIDFVAGPDPLPTAAVNAFDWGSIYAAAQYFDEFLANGRRRFEGSYSFAQQTTLQAIDEQILRCCRSFGTEYAGKIGMKCDMPRSSVFTFSRANILPGSWDADDQKLHTGANSYLGRFLDLLVPACSQVASIVWPNVATQEPHPFVPGDWIQMGATGTPYDGVWQVNTVPDVENPGTPEEVDPSTFTLVSKGENYPYTVGAVGSIGLLYSRFKKRTPIFDHKANQYARGAVGVGLPRQRDKVKETLDYATSTWDQVARITAYERDRLLGVDVVNAGGALVPSAPYVTPPVVKLKTSFFANDAYGNLAAAVECGDHVTIDTTANFQYAGEYEVLDGLEKVPPTCQATGSGGAIALKPSESSGEIGFVLGPYNPAIMYDTSDPTQNGDPEVPGSDPGNNSNFTSIPLASGGTWAFFTGLGASGSPFQLPSTGFPTANVLAWAGPAGYLFNDNIMHIVAQCSVSASLLLTLQYEDGEGHLWNGDVNYACLTWLSADVTNVADGLTWLPLTLLGGEEIVWGMGVVAGDGSFTVELPAGYTAAKSFMVAYPHDASVPTGNQAHWVGAYVDDVQAVHCNYKDGSGNVWHGNAAVLVFAWKNNMGSITTETLSGGNWMQCTLTNGQVFGVGCALGVANGATLTLPESAGDGSTLEAMVGTSGWDYADNGTPATGVKDSYLDADNVVHIDFGNNTGSIIWPGAADVFALYCTTGLSVGTIVQVTPPTQSVAAGAQVQFDAAVLNNANPNVSWSVDGNMGGNITVGTVDATGNYNAPDTAGTHEITATSVADPTASGSATVTVWGTVYDPENIIVVGDTPVTVDGDQIDVA